MTTHTIQNENLIVSVKSDGAELCKILNKKNNTDYLWSGDSKYWGRHAPVLFPIIGKVINDQTNIKNKNYKIGQHGFARDLEHTLIEQNHTKLVFNLEESDATKEKYPWSFQLTSSYEVNNNSVEQSFTVKNKDQEIIYFSLGFHPAFPWPLDPSTNKEDWSIEFENSETKNQWDFKDGYITEKQTPFLNNQKSFNLYDDLFKNDVLIFEKLKSKSVALSSDKSNMKLIVHAEDYPFTGIWTKPGNPFICVEPWYGIADSSAKERCFENKIGIQSLKPGDTFNCKMAFEII